MEKKEPAGCLGVILSLLGIAPDSKDRSFPYKKKDWLLTRAERSFFGVLVSVVDPEQIVFSKVRLADLLYIPRGTKSRQAAFNRIQSKHIDFVVCDKDTIRPFLAIEFDDSSHDSPSRRKRDEFVDKAMKSAHLPLLRVRAQKAYVQSALKQSIELHVEDVALIKPDTN